MFPAISPQAGDVQLTLALEAGALAIWTKSDDGNGEGPADPRR
jgi:hypothetical protein